MSTTVEIRPALDSDREAIRQMAQEVVDAGDAFVFDAVSDVMDYWYQPDGHVFVAIKGGDAVGTYVVKPNQRGRGSHVANTGYMVSKAARGLGLGRSMGEHSLTTARELGFTAMQFNMVVATNVNAVRLWENLGFEVVGRLPGVFRHADLGNVDALIMFRTL